MRRTQKALRFGAKLNLVGMALTLLAAERVAGADHGSWWHLAL